MNKLTRIASTVLLATVLLTSCTKPDEEIPENTCDCRFMRLGPAEITWTNGLPSVSQHQIWTDSDIDDCDFAGMETSAGVLICEEK